MRRHRPTSSSSAAHRLPADRESRPASPGPGPALRRAAAAIPADAPAGLDDRLLAALAGPVAPASRATPSRGVIGWASLAAAAVVAMLTIAALALPGGHTSVRSRPVVVQAPPSHGMLAATEWVFAAELPDLRQLAEASYSPALDAVRPPEKPFDWAAPWLPDPES